jgi:PAS domain S-box-containing protein
MTSFSPILQYAFLALALLIGLILVGLPRRGEVGQTMARLYGAILALAAIAIAFLKYKYSDLFGPYFEYSLSLFHVIEGVVFLAFALEYLKGRIRRYAHLFILSVPFIFLAGNYFLGRLMGPAPDGRSLIPAAEIWNHSLTRINLVYALGMYASTLIIFTYIIDVRFSIRRNRLVLVIIAAIFLATSILIGQILLRVPSDPLAFLILSLPGIALINYRIHYDPKEVSHIYTDYLIDHLEDGFIVINGNDTIIGANQAALDLLGVTAREIWGHPIEQAFPDWKRISLNIVPSLEFRGSVYIGQRWKYLHVRLHPIQKLASTKAIIIRDITDSRMAEDARQSAREKMFVFLRSLANTFREALTIEDFLRHALYQTSYTFKIHSGALALLEPSPETQQLNIVSTIRYGSPPQVELILSEIYPLLSSAETQAKKEPLLIRNAKQDQKVGAHLGALVGDSSLLIFPLVANEEIVGAMILIRSKPDEFSPYDVTRLGIVAEEIALYIFTERQKHQQIAFAERQRLMRDLHDSVTQKLYGLVTLSEAIQLGMQTGHTEKSLALIPNISENARQALREMRLFLHEIEPVDLGKEGLIAAIHQRLLAVEGRSDIQARLVTDGEFFFSRNRERAIYYIVEEALNNALKHAQAKSILVRFRYRSGKTYVDIIDDGRGYDSSRVPPGGRGIKNMKERARQIGGKLSIVSENNGGTRVTLSLPPEG